MDKKEMEEITNTIAGVVKDENEKTAKMLKDEQDTKLKEFGEALKGLELQIKKTAVNEDDKEAMKKRIIVSTFIKTIQQDAKTEEQGKAIFQEEVKAAYQSQWTAWEGWELIWWGYSADVLKVMKSYPLVNELIIIGIKEKSFTFPKFADDMTSYWTSEASSYTWTKGTTGSLALTVQKLTTMVQLTDEFKSWVLTTESAYQLIVDGMGSSRAAKIEDGVINWGGAMTGILWASGVGAASLASGSTTLTWASATVADDGLNDLDTLIAPEYETEPDNMIALMSKYTLNKYKSKRTTTGAYMYPELREKNPSLLGKFRIILSSKMPVQNTAGDVAGAKHTLIGNLKKFYKVVERGNESVIEGFQSWDFVAGLSTLRAQRELAGWLWDTAAFAFLKNAAS